MQIWLNYLHNSHNYMFIRYGWQFASFFIQSDCALWKYTLTGGGIVSFIPPKNNMNAEVEIPDSGWPHSLRFLASFIFWRFEWELCQLYLSLYLEPKQTSNTMSNDPAYAPSPSKVDEHSCPSVTLVFYRESHRLSRFSVWYSKTPRIV